MANQSLLTYSEELNRLTESLIEYQRLISTSRINLIFHTGAIFVEYGRIHMILGETIIKTQSVTDAFSDSIRDFSKEIAQRVTAIQQQIIGVLTNNEDNDYLPLLNELINYHNTHRNN